MSDGKFYFLWTEYRESQPCNMNSVHVFLHKEPAPVFSGNGLQVIPGKTSNNIYLVSPVSQAPCQFIKQVCCRAYFGGEISGQKQNIQKISIFSQRRKVRKGYRLFTIRMLLWIFKLLLTIILAISFSVIFLSVLCAFARPILPSNTLPFSRKDARFAKSTDYLQYV